MTTAPINTESNTKSESLKNMETPTYDRHKYLFEKTEYVFVRINDNDHCVSMAGITKTHEVVWMDGKNAILKMAKGMYDCHRSWLISHPFLSCYYEVQLIKLKPMKYKVLKGTALFDSLTALYARIKESKDACRALCIEFGAENFSPSQHSLAGKIGAFYFTSSDLPHENWMRKERGNYTHWFMPKQPKTKNDPLHEVWAKINAVPVVDYKDLENLLQYKQTSYSTESSIGWFTRPSIGWYNDYILIGFPEELEYQPVADMVEILLSENKELQIGKSLEF